MRPDEELPLSPRKPIAEDVSRELAHHLEQRTAELVSDGWSADAARAEAMRVFGDIPAITAECHDITSRDRRVRRRGTWISELHGDMAFGLRLLKRSPAFTVVAVLTLALGIGANTAVFSVINALVLRPLPYVHPEQLVDLSERHKRGSANLSWANFRDLQDGSHAFDAMAAYGGDREAILGGDSPQRIMVTQVSRDFFRVMRATPIVGRLPQADEFRIGATPVAVVSESFWRNHLKGNRDLAGVSLRGEFAFQVVGVMPDGFNFPEQSDLWYPLELDQQSVSRTAHNWNAIARIAPNSSMRAATRDLDMVIGRIAAEHPADFDAIGVTVTPLQDLLTAPIRKPLFLLLGAAALVLLTACTNLASTLLARGAVRSRELAIRTAIGAGRTRIIRQIFTESLVLAAFGALAGIALGYALLHLLLAAAPPSLGALSDVSLDGRVLIAAFATAMITAVLFGLLPALSISQVHPGQLMRGGTRGGSGPKRSIWTALIIAEVALAVVLLIGSSLLLRSFAAVTHVNLGFVPERAMTINVDLPEQSYPNVADAVAFHDQALQAIRNVPGVVAAGVINVMPLDGRFPSGGIQVDGKAPTATTMPITGYAVYRIASAGYFAAVGTKIVAGRDFLESDDAHSPRVAVINQAFAKREWPDTNPIGKRFRIGGMDGPGMDEWATVVGVAQDVPDIGATQGTEAAYFFSYRQVPKRSRYLTAVVRTSGSPTATIPQLRTVLTGIAPSVPFEFRALSDRVASTVADRRFTMLLVVGFGVLALMLAGVGIYGVVSYSVAQRTREIGIRMALGAAPSGIRWMVHAAMLRAVGAGVVLGALVSLAATRVLRAVLFDVTPSDPVSFGAVALLLMITSAVASWLPALRGTRINPIAAIRAE